MTTRTFNDAGIAFVFPGLGSGFVGAGEGLPEAFPSLEAHLDAVYGAAPPTAPLYPLEPARRLGAPLACNGTALGAAELYLQVLYAAMAQQVMGLRPAAAIGMSLGGVAMVPLISGSAEVLADLLTVSPSLADCVGALGDMTWVGEGAASDDWANVLVTTRPEALQAALTAEPELYLAVRCDDASAIVSGPAGRVRAVLRQHNVAFRIMSVGLAYLHTPHIAPRVEQLLAGIVPKLLKAPRERLRGIDFYLTDRPLRPGASPVALAAYYDQLAASLCKPLDFPAIVRAAYRRGIRIFITIGPAERVERWIDRILEGSPHLAVSLAPTDTPPLLALRAATEMLQDAGIAINPALPDRTEPSA